MERKKMLIVVPELKPMYKLEERDHEIILGYIKKKRDIKDLIEELNKSSIKYHIFSLEAPSLRVCREVDKKTETIDECDLEAKINVLCGDNIQKKHLLCNISESDDPTPILRIQPIIKERLSMLNVLWAALEGITLYSLPIWLENCPELFASGADMALIFEDNADGEANVAMFRAFNEEQSKRTS